MGKGKRQNPGRRRGQIEYYVVVEGEPNPEVLVQNYIWCLKQRYKNQARGSTSDE